MPSRCPWKIRVAHKDKDIASFEVPEHKLGSKEIGTFLHALVVRYRTETAEEMLPYYVNGRKGLPEKSPFANIVRYDRLDLREVGFFCGDWECYAMATQTISEEHAAIIQQLHEQNRRSAL